MSVKHMKKWVSTILILAGIIMIVYSLYQISYWRFYNGYSEEIPVLAADSEQGSIMKNEILLRKKTQRTNKNNEVQQAEEDMWDGYNISRDSYEDGMMSINIPKLEVKSSVVDGTTAGELKKGPGLYEISPLPSNTDVNVCIAGHRTTYGAWFRHVDKLVKDDEIIIKFLNREFIYKVEKVFIVDKKDWSVTENAGYSALTLTSCHPLRSNRQRIIVRAKLEEIKS